MKTLSVLVALTVLGACSQTVSSNKTPLAPSAALDVASADPNNAACRHGTIEARRSFLLCENGALRKKVLEAALNSPADTDMEIAMIAKRYGKASQSFTGISTATYLETKGVAFSVAQTGQPEVQQRASVKILGRIFDVHHVGDEVQNGTIFVERKGVQ